MKKLLRLLNFAPIKALLLLASCLAALVSIGYALGLSKSDWASWVQALGSVVAIFLTYYLFQRQKKHELERMKNDELLARARSVRVVQATAFWAIEVIAQCVEERQNDYPSVILPGLQQRLDDLRSVCNGFVDTAGDEIVVLCALKYGHMLAETKADFQAREDSVHEMIIGRMEGRLAEANKLHAALIAHQNRLEQLLKDRGIAADPALQSVRQLTEPVTE